MHLPDPSGPASEPQTFYGRELVFYPKSHRYKWGGEWVPSVTTIINRLGKESLIQWAANCAVEHIRRSLAGYPDGYRVTPGTVENLCSEARLAHRTIKEDAGDIGTRVHDYARLVLQGRSPPEPLDGPAQKAIEAFWQWVEQHAIEPIAIERRILSKTYMYAGTCDFLGLIDGRLSVLDFKTGRGVYDEAWWQTSGYQLAIEEELGDMHRIAARWIVHLDKTTGEMTAHCRDSREDREQDMAVWLALVGVDKALRTARKHPQPRRAA